MIKLQSTIIMLTMSINPELDTSVWIEDQKIITDLYREPTHRCQ